jgi:hypothetical protein
MPECGHFPNAHFFCRAAHTCSSYVAVLVWKLLAVQRLLPLPPACIMPLSLSIPDFHPQRFCLPPTANIVDACASAVNQFHRRIKEIIKAPKVIQYSPYSSKYSARMQCLLRSSVFSCFCQASHLNPNLMVSNNSEPKSQLR